jgi:hypothetical protein
MPCDTRLKVGPAGITQSISSRAEEIRAAVAKLAQGLATGRVRAKIGPQGGIAFTGLTDEERDGATDNCLYRRILATGSATAKAAIARAEQLAGRTVDRRLVATGTHSHDGGQTWHSGH